MSKFSVSFDGHRFLRLMPLLASSLLLVCVFLFAALFVSCRTFSGTPREIPDYTDEQIRSSEAQNVRRSLAEKPVYSLWLSQLLLQKAPGDSALTELLSDCAAEVKSAMEKAVSAGQWYEAEKLCKTLLCVCGSEAVTADIQASIQAGLAEKTLAEKTFAKQ